MTVDTVIRGGTLVTQNEMFDADIGIDQGKISTISEPGSLDADVYIDANGELVMPGIVDPHVHIDDMFSIDTYRSASAAAALGGITTVIDFAWQAWEGELGIWNDTSTVLEGINRKREKASDSLIDYSLHGGITRTDPEFFEEIDAVIDQGVTSFKMFTAYELSLPNGFMNEVFQALADRDAVAALHTEDASVCEYITDKYKAEGKGDAKWYPSSRPDYAEAMAAEDAVRMATEAGCKYYGIHTTCRKSAKVLEEFQREYGRNLVRAETCTHYTTLNDSIYEELGNLPMIAPPIRTQEDVTAIIDHLEDGLLDVISTDHCAFTEESKQTANWWDSSFGTNTLQFSLPILHDVLVNEHGFSYPSLVSLTSSTPARLFGLNEKGTLQPGTDADIVLFDPKEKFEISAEDNASKADYSLYEGREVRGAVTKTIVRGELIADAGDIVGQDGYGEFVEREIPDWRPA